MLRYENISSYTIQVDLGNEYSVLAMPRWDRRIKKFITNFYIKKNDNELLDLVNGLENEGIDSNFKNIKADLAKYITNLHKDKYFDYYILRYAYILKCFDRGNKLFEQENAGWDTSYF